MLQLWQLATLHLLKWFVVRVEGGVVVVKQMAANCWTFLWVCSYPDVGLRGSGQVPNGWAGPTESHAKTYPTMVGEGQYIPGS
jgi:hypothetical protein